MDLFIHLSCFLTWKVTKIFKISSKLPPVSINFSSSSSNCAKTFPIWTARPRPRSMATILFKTICKVSNNSYNSWTALEVESTWEVAWIQPATPSATAVEAVARVVQAVLAVAVDIDTIIRTMAVVAAVVLTILNRALVMAATQWSIIIKLFWTANSINSSQRGSEDTAPFSVRSSWSSWSLRLPRHTIRTSFFARIWPAKLIWKRKESK